MPARNHHEILWRFAISYLRGAVAGRKKASPLVETCPLKIVLVSHEGFGAFVVGFFMRRCFSVRPMGARETKATIDRLRDFSKREGRLAGPAQGSGSAAANLVLNRARVPLIL